MKSIEESRFHRILGGSYLKGFRPVAGPGRPEEGSKEMQVQVFIGPCDQIGPMLCHFGPVLVPCLA